MESFCSPRKIYAPIGMLYKAGTCSVPDQGAGNEGSSRRSLARGVLIFLKIKNGNRGVVPVGALFAHRFIDFLRYGFNRLFGRFV